MSDELKQAILALQVEIRDSFRETRILLEGSRHETQAVAEAVRHFDAKLEQVRSEQSEGFEETQAMITISHSQLVDRVASLESRVERLESIVLSDGKSQ